MGLVRNGKLVGDQYTDVSGLEEIPDHGAVLVSLEQWQDHWESLIKRKEPIGLRLRSDQHPEIIADDLEQLSLIALEFPSFRDGRAYSYARLLRERYGFEGELRAIGDVLLDQLAYMQRCGFDAFEISHADPLATYHKALTDFSVWYQPATDQRRSAVQLRHAREA